MTINNSTIHDFTIQIKESHENIDIKFNDFDIIGNPMAVLYPNDHTEIILTYIEDANYYNMYHQCNIEHKPDPALYEQYKDTNGMIHFSGNIENKQQFQETVENYCNYVINHNNY